MAFDSITYEEPSAVTLLILLGFYFCLQFGRIIADYVLSAGLLGEIAVGIIFGGPLAGILPVEWEETWLVIGYLGLILIVFEGGLDFNAKIFVRALPLSFIAASWGVLLPIAFSFAILWKAFDLPIISAFTSGCALSSTSLGTTFFVLQSQTQKGLNVKATRVGTLLTAIALIDDVIALVLLTVVKALGSGSDKSLGAIIGLPVGTSIALSIGSPVVTYAFRPIYRKYLEKHVEKLGYRAFITVGFLVLSAFLAVSYYIQTTMLLGAYLAGVFLSVISTNNQFLKVWEENLSSLHKRYLASIFFGSIGMSVPFLQLFTAERFWKGLVYSVLMLLGKLLVGIWVPIRNLFSKPLKNDNMDLEKSSNNDNKSSLKYSRFSSGTLYAGLALGAAMVARGEIGILILQVALTTSQSSGGENQIVVMDEETYLIGIWAVAWCTLIGPPLFGFLIRFKGRKIIDSDWGSV